MDENIKTDLQYMSALNNPLMGLDIMKNPLEDKIQVSAPKQLNISDQKKVELQAIAEKEKRKKDRKAYWHISQNELVNDAPNLLQAGFDALPGIIAGIANNDYSNALASFTTGATNPTVDVIKKTHQMLESMNLNKQSIPGQGIKSGESQFAKQGMKINYMTLFK